MKVTTHHIDKLIGLFDRQGIDHDHYAAAP